MTDTTLTNVETLLNKVVPHVPGCNDTIAKLALCEAARTFARESDIVTETRTFSVDNAPELYKLPENSSLPEKFLPLHFISRKHNRTDNTTVDVTYSLLPIGNELPDDVVKRHYEAIVSCALFDLFNMPGKPWSNPQMANYHLQKYRIALGDAMRDNNTNGAVFHQQVCVAENTEIFLG
jgi:hypothetical protein